MFVGLFVYLSYCVLKVVMDVIMCVLCIEFGLYGICVNSVNFIVMFMLMV